MSVDAARDRLPDWDPQPALDQLRTARDRAAALVFGDELGTLLFMGALLFFALYWRIGIFITDNWTIANTLVAVADGHLYLDEFVYGPPGVVTPGVFFVEGTPYGRNYGQVFLALPFLWGLEVVGFVADLRIAVAGAWSLLLLAFVMRVGALLEVRERFTWLGVAGALLAFVVNTVFAVPIEPRMRYLMALQLSTMVFAALIGVVLYRLVAAIHDRRTGVFVGAATVLATPVGFWASLPKRHVLMALLVVVLLLAFYQSRAVESDQTALLTRGLAYATVGLAAWVNAPEALVLLVVLAPLDLATARSNRWRRLVVVGALFVVSLLPFFVTNVLISGNPMHPPRYFKWLLRAPDVGPGAGAVTPTPSGPKTPTPGTAVETTAVPETGGEPGTPEPVGTPGAGAGEGGPSPPNPGGSIVDTFESIATWTVGGITTFAASAFGSVVELSEQFQWSYKSLTYRPMRVYYTFVQSAPGRTNATPTDLAILETAPILGAVVGAPLELARRRRVRPNAVWTRLRTSPAIQTDLLGVAIVVIYTLLYISRLPDFAMWTVRYLLPFFPIGMYFVGRLAPVRRVVLEEARLLIYAYSILVLVGGQLLVVYMFSLDPTRGEVIQLHGVLGLIAAAVILLWMVLEVLNIFDETRIGALALAGPLAVGTLFVLFTGLEYFVVGPHALGMADLVSRAIPLF